MEIKVLGYVLSMGSKFYLYKEVGDHNTERIYKTWCLNSLNSLEDIWYSYAHVEYSSIDEIFEEAELHTDNGSQEEVVLFREDQIFYANVGV